jgi:hypothetical protein
VAKGATQRAPVQDRMPVRRGRRRAASGSEPSRRHRAADQHGGDTHHTRCPRGHAAGRLERFRVAAEPVQQVRPPSRAGLPAAAARCVLRRVARLPSLPRGRADLWFIATGAAVGHHRRTGAARACNAMRASLACPPRSVPRHAAWAVVHRDHGPLTQLVECDRHKVEVAGSNPARPTIPDPRGRDTACPTVDPSRLRDPRLHDRAGNAGSRPLRLSDPVPLPIARRWTPSPASLRSTRRASGPGWCPAR